MAKVFYDKLRHFKGSIARKIADRGDWASYSVNTDSVRYGLELTDYGNVTINGDLPELSIGIEYEIEAYQTDYKGSYRVKTIRRDEPLTKDGVRSFLEEITSVDRAYYLSEAYPDIIERVKNENLEDIDLSKIKGVGQVTFDKIIQGIRDNFHLADIVAEFNGLLSFSIVRRLYAKYGSAMMLRNELKKNPYKALTEVSGIGFKIADGIVLMLQDEGIIKFGFDIATSVDRCEACIEYVLGRNEDNGNTRMSIDDLMKEVDNNAHKCAHMFDVAITNQKFRYDRSRREVSLRRTYGMERDIAYAIIDNIDNNVNKWQCDTEKYRNIGEFNLSDEQLSALDILCVSPISILNGFAGSGKSFTTKAIINMLDDMNKTYKLFAPTGKAAKVLHEATEREAQTLHRGLGYEPSGGFRYNGYHKLDVDVIIVDEVSMVDVYMFYSLIQAIDFDVTKILLIGDSAQLPSVGCGNILHDLMQSAIIPTTTLSKIFRYGEGGVMKVATDIRMCKPYMNSQMKNSQTRFGMNGDYVFFDTGDDSEGNITANRMLAIYSKLLESGCKVSDIQVVVAKNIGKFGVDKYNPLLQQVANPNYGKGAAFKHGETMYYVGDMIIQTANNYHARKSETIMSPQDIEFYHQCDKKEWPDCFVANGENGIVTGVAPDFIDIDFGNEYVVRYNHQECANIKLGYAITCHKSQGSGFDNVILVTVKSDTYTLNSNLLYVGVTRSKKRCFHIGQVDTVNRVIKKKENMERKTHLLHLLRQMYNDKLKN